MKHLELVWARLYSEIDAYNPKRPDADAIDFTAYDGLTVHLKTHISIILFPSEETAREAQKRCGGIVIQLDPTSLRGQAANFSGEEDEQNILHIVETGDNGEGSSEPPTVLPKVANISACIASFPNRHDFERMEDLEGAEVEVDHIEMCDEAAHWAGGIAELTGTAAILE